jgi:hypothetical protein
LVTWILEMGMNVKTKQVAFRVTYLQKARKGSPYPIAGTAQLYDNLINTIVFRAAGRRLVNLPLLANPETRIH